MMKKDFPLLAGLYFLHLELRLHPQALLVVFRVLEVGEAACAPALRALPFVEIPEIWIHPRQSTRLRRRGEEGWEDEGVGREAGGGIQPERIQRDAMSRCGVPPFLPPTLPSISLPPLPSLQPILFTTRHAVVDRKPVAVSYYKTEVEEVIHESQPN